LSLRPILRHGDWCRLARVLAALLVAVPAHSVAVLRYLESDAIDIGGADLVFGAAGYAHVAGIVDSYVFPGLDSGLVTNAGYGMRYVAKVDLITRRPVWIAVVGAPSKDSNGASLQSFGEFEARGLAVSGNGDAFLVAHHGNTTYPQTGGQYGAAASKQVFRVSASGQVSQLSAALDPAIRRVGAIALDPAGNIYLTGSAGGGLQTTVNAPFPAGSVAAGCVAPFVIKLDPSGQSIVYSTYLGFAGTQGERCGAGSPYGVFDPTGFAIAVDPAGNAIVGGQAEPGVRATPGSPDFGSKEATVYVPTVKGYASHAFIAKINPAGNAIVFMARLGGSQRDRVTSLALDAAGAIYLGGKTASEDFPSTPHFGPIFPISFLSCPGFPNAPEMGFVAKLAADGKQILYSGFLPVFGTQLANCGGSPGAAFSPVVVALDSSGRLYATGRASPLRYYVPLSSSIRTVNALGILFVVAADGRTLDYSTGLPGFAPLTAAFDPWGHFWIGGEALKRFSTGTLPVEFTNVTPLCASGGTLSARVAGANSLGTVEFFANGASLGSVPVTNGIASRAAALPAGVQRFVATYHGSSYFDGYSTEPTYLAIDQAGACR
jgi:hypothetical protein